MHAGLNIVGSVSGRHVFPRRSRSCLPGRAQQKIPLPLLLTMRPQVALAAHTGQ